MRGWGKCFNVYERQRANIANIKKNSKIKKKAYNNRKMVKVYGCRIQTVYR